MGWWFGRKAMEPARPFIPAWLTGEGEECGFVRGYEAQLNEVYRRNPVGLRSVRLVAGLVGALPLFAKEGDAEAVKLAKTGGLMERAAASLLLHGNAYVRLAVDGHDRPAELHLMRPERVSIASGADGWPSAYLYRAGGQVTRVPKNDGLGRRQVAHLKALDPSDDHLVATGATDAWSGHDGALSCFTEGGWRFVAPVDGASVWDGASGQTFVRRDGVWEAGIVRAQEVRIDSQTVLRNRQPAIVDPVGGSVMDTQCRSAVTSILVALRTHGLIA